MKHVSTENHELITRRALKNDNLVNSTALSETSPKIIFVGKAIYLELDKVTVTGKNQFTLIALLVMH